MAQSFDVNAYPNLPVPIHPPRQAIEDQRRASAYTAEKFQKVQQDTLDQDRYDRSGGTRDRVFDATFEAPDYTGVQRDDAVYEQLRERQQYSFKDFQEDTARDAHEVPAGLALYVATLYQENRSRANAPTNPGGNLDLET